MREHRVANSQGADLSQSARPRLRTLARLVRDELAYRDARHLRRHFCWPCDKRTFLQHTHTAAFDRGR